MSPGKFFIYDLIAETVLIALQITDTFAAYISYSEQ